jgi:hypothetical protein
MKTLASILVAVAVLLGAASAQAEISIYVGDTKEYAVAFKAEGVQLYVLELAGTTDCYYTEPHEDIGPGGFSVFAAPKLMREGSGGFFAEAIGAGYARVRAELSGDAVTGDFSFSESEESFHCDTGFTPDPFQASRYQPIGSAGAAALASGEKGIYYGSEGPIEIFLRASERDAGGIRGSFVPRCRVGRGKTIPARHALFRAPAFAKLSEDGSFEQGFVNHGRTRSGARYRESVSLAGRVEQDAVTGTYLRVRTTKPRRKAARRCSTGPLPFRAVRYLSAGS